MIQNITFLGNIPRRIVLMTTILPRKKQNITLYLIPSVSQSPQLSAKVDELKRTKSDEIICPADASHVISDEIMDQLVGVFKDWSTVFKAYPPVANMT